MREALGIDNKTGENMSDAIPSTLEYNESFADQVESARGKKFKNPKEGWMRLVFNKGDKKRTCKSGNFELTKRLSPVDANGERVEGGTTKIRMYPVAQNTAVAGHKPPNTTFGNYCLARAIEADIPGYPHKDGEEFVGRDGSTIDEDTYLAQRRETRVAVGKLSVSWYNDPTQLDDEVIWGLVVHEEGKDGKIYTEVKRTRAEKPEGDDLVVDGTTFPIITEDFFA